MSALLVVPPALGLAVLLWMLLRLERQPSPDPHGKVVQLHHGYIGFVLSLLAILALRDRQPVWLFALGVIAYLFGLWWLGDDGYQHWRQYTQPFYRSSWHNWAHRRGLT